MQPTNPILGGQPGGGIGGTPPALSQQTPMSPSFQPGLLPSSPFPMPEKSPMSALHKAIARRQPQQGQAPQSGQNQGNTITLPVSDQNPQQPGTQVPQSEAQMLIKALQEMAKPLSERVKMLTKKEEQLNNHIDRTRQAYMDQNALMRGDMTRSGEGTELPR